MKERLFIEDSINQNLLEHYLKKRFEEAKVSDIQIQRTPLGTRIIVYTTSPGIIIGRKGENLQETVEELKQRFKIDNPNIDVRKIKNPDLDPNIVAKSIVFALERGVNNKRLGKYYLQRVMDAGAIGAEIILSGLVGSERSRLSRFKAGYITKSGDTTEKCVDKAKANANLKRGTIGVSVAIMLKHPELEAKNVEINEEPEEKTEQKKKEKKPKKTTKKKTVKKTKKTTKTKTKKGGKKS